MNRKNLFQLSAAAAVIALGVGTWWLTREKSSGNSLLPANGEEVARREEGERIAKVNAEMAAKREAGQAQVPGMIGKTPDGKTIQAPPDYGSLKAINPDASPQAKAAVEAALSKTHPERLTCAVLPAKFDAKKWVEDAAYKAEYLRVPEPARCYQSAQPAKGVARIALASPAYLETLQSQPVDLRVKATPGMPVTFTSFDAAMFTAGSGNTGSQLTTQTVVADENGIATATLVATSGVIDDCRVIASCPVDAGLAKITVHAKLPENAQSPANATAPVAQPAASASPTPASRS